MVMAMPYTFHILGLVVVAAAAFIIFIVSVYDR